MYRLVVQSDGSKLNSLVLLNSLNSNLVRTRFVDNNSTCISSILCTTLNTDKSQDD